MRRRHPCMLIAALLLISGCSDEEFGTERPNQLPETRISNAPPQASSSSFQVRIDWFGDDPDGEVVQYLYAWDDTTEWNRMTTCGSTFVVSADSCTTCERNPSYYRFECRHERVHTFWVKAVDDCGAQDPTPAYRSFTAWTTAPITEITRGPCESGTCGQTGTSVIYEWTGFDPDGGEVDSFFYKLNVGPPSEMVDCTWVRVGADCTYVRFKEVENTFPETGSYPSFAVVAKDNAGALERVLVPTQNWCCFEPVPGQNARVEINGGILGRRNNKAPSGPEYDGNVGEVFQGFPVSFTWEADASGYGGNIVGYRYALEYPSGWTEWETDHTSYPPEAQTFVPTTGYHVLYVEALDNLGTETRCYFRFQVEPGPQVGDTYPLLVVDDSQYSGLPDAVGAWDPSGADDAESRFFDTILEGYGYTEWDCLERDREPPPMSLAGRHRTVLWYVDDYDEEGNSLREVFLRGTRFMDSYVRAGGNWILIGRNPALFLDADCRGNRNYPFRYDVAHCDEGEWPPISTTAFGINELFFVGDPLFKGAISACAGYPDLPLGEMWPLFAEPETTYLWAVEAFNADGINAEINAIPIYEVDYSEDPGGGWGWPYDFCAVIVDNSGDPSTGSTAYFGWPLIWCDWDSVAVMMRKVLSDLCGEEPAGPP